MRSFDAPTLAALQNRTERMMRILVWITARNRSTGLPEQLGLWNGGYDRSFTINSVARTYIGAGALMQVPPLVYQVGLNVRMQRLSLSPIDATVGAMIRTYDSRLAPIEIHRAVFDPTTHALISEPHRLFKGIVDELEVTTDPKGETRCEVSVASSARYLTRTLTLKRSDESQKLRSGDRFLRYADVSGEVDVYWGENRPASAAAAPPRNGGLFGTHK